MAANLSKKEIHSLFVSNHKGTTLNENYLLIILPLLLHLCHSIWTLNMFQLGCGDFKGNIIINFVSVAVPLIFSLTVLSEHLFEVCTFLFIFCVVGAINSIILSRATKYSTEIRSTVHNPSSEKGRVGFLFISQVRGCVLLSGAVCILAVDMKVFPRRWAKTEIYGTGLMDLGVGTFALIMGLVWPSCVNRARFIRQCAILFMLGTIRLVTVKWLSYNEHESEYGRHWNFFFTLALVYVAGAIFSSLLRSISRLLLAIIIMASLQHLLLVNLKFEDFCLQNDMNRDSSLLVANKEGIISICGYVILWLVGRLVTKLMKYKRIWYIFLTALCIVAHLLLHWQYFKVSRRSANLAYIVWTSSCVSVSILITYLGDIIINCLEDRANYVNRLECPDLYCIVNRRGLCHFVFANIITGIVNLSMVTQKLDDCQSLLILTAYTALPLALIHAADRYQHSNGHSKHE